MVRVFFMGDYKSFVMLLPLLLIATACSGGCKSSYNKPIIREVKKSEVRQKANFVKGLLIVKFVNSATQKEIDEINFRFNSSITKPVNIERKVYLIKLPENLSVEEAILLYSKEDSVDYAEPNYIYRTQNRGVAE